MIKIPELCNFKNSNNNAKLKVYDDNLCFYPTYPIMSK